MQKISQILISWKAPPLPPAKKGSKSENFGTFWCKEKPSDYLDKGLEIKIPDKIFLKICRNNADFYVMKPPSPPGKKGGLKGSNKLTIFWI